MGAEAQEEGPSPEKKDTPLLRSNNDGDGNACDEVSRVPVEANAYDISSLYIDVLRLSKVL